MDTVSRAGWTFCETAIGRVAVAWNERGIVGIRLPGASDARTREHLLRAHPGLAEAAPPPSVRDACERIVSLLDGAVVDLSGIALDMSGVTQFRREVYTVTRGIPPGETLTYGEVAARLGRPGVARAVGQALGSNPFPIVVPCHRVLAANGRPGGFSAEGGVATKSRMLAIEGVRLGGRPEAGARRLGFDPVRAVEYLSGRDPALGRVISRVGPFRLELKNAPTTFAALAEAITYQQLGTRAAEAIFARVRAGFSGGASELRAEEILAATDEQLRAAGLSRPKLLALRDLAAREVGGELPGLAEAGGLDDEAVIDRLTRVRGIGRWTAQMFLIFHLGRPDVLPADDYALRRALMSACGLPEIPGRDEAERRGSQWAPYRTVASWYLWEWSVLPDTR